MTSSVTELTHGAVHDEAPRVASARLLAPPQTTRSSKSHTISASCSPPRAKQKVFSLAGCRP